MNKPYKIPTLLALPLIVVLVLAVAFTTNLLTGETQADQNTIPRNIQITNLTENSFTVSWITDKPTRGVINVTSQNSRNLPFFDDRTVAGNETFTVHSITARGLTAQTPYTVTILPQGRGTKPIALTVTTFPAISPSSNQLGPSYGTVLLPDTTPAQAAIVYLSLPNSQTLSALVKSSGSFLIPLNLIRNKTGDTFYAVQDTRIPITLTVVNGTLTSIVTTTTENDAPVPTITLGKNYDATVDQVNTKPSPSPLLSDAAGLSTVLGERGDVSSSQSIALTAPAQGQKSSANIPSLLELVFRIILSQ